MVSALLQAALAKVVENMCKKSSTPRPTRNVVKRTECKVGNVAGLHAIVGHVRTAQGWRGCTPTIRLGDRWSGTEERLC